MARTYYKDARLYWDQAVTYAEEASEYRFTLDLPTIESKRHLIMIGKLDYDRIIDRHLYKVEEKLGLPTEFLDEEGRPRPVKEAMQRTIEELYDENFTPRPLGPPVLDPEWKEQPLFEDYSVLEGEGGDGIGGGTNGGADDETGGDANGGAPGEAQAGDDAAN